MVLERRGDAALPCPVTRASVTCPGGDRRGGQDLEVLREPSRERLSRAGTMARCARQECQSPASGMAAKSCRASPGSQWVCAWVLAGCWEGVHPLLQGASPVPWAFPAGAAGMSWSCRRPKGRVLWLLPLPRMEPSVAGRSPWLWLWQPRGRDRGTCRPERGAGLVRPVRRPVQLAVSLSRVWPSPAGTPSGHQAPRPGVWLPRLPGACGSRWLAPVPRG